MTRTSTEEEFFRYRILPIAHSLRHSFSHIIIEKKGVWRDQLFFHSEGKKLYSITPLKDYKYVDPAKIVSEMMEALQSTEVTEAIYLCSRQMELDSGPIDTLNINYIGPAAWDGGSVCLPYVYTTRTNEIHVIEHPFFDKIADKFNEDILSSLRNSFYGVSNIPFSERTRLLISKGYRVMDSDTILKRQVAAVIATLGVL